MLLYRVLHVLCPDETPGQLHHPVLVLEILQPALVYCKVSDLVAKALIPVADKRDIPLATYFHQPGILRTVIGYKYVVSPLALVQSKLQVDVGRTSVCTYHIADRSLQTVMTLPASQHQRKLRRIHERSLEPFIAAHVSILEYRRTGDYPVDAHGLCKPGEQRLRAYEQRCALYELCSMYDVLYRTVLCDILCECVVVLRMSYVQYAVFAGQSLKRSEIRAASVPGYCSKYDIGLLYMSVLWNCDPRLHCLLQRLVVCERYSVPEICLFVYSRYLLPP